MIPPVAAATRLLGPGFGVAGGPVEETPPALIGAEADAVARAIPARRAEFAAGRAAIRAALARIGQPPVAIPRGPGGAPVWPPGVTGSLSHGGGAVIAVVSATPGLTVGVDLEPWAPLDDETARAIGAPPGFDGLRVFAAREAAYKAQFPVTGALLDHADIDVGLDGDRFVAQLRRPVASSLAGTQTLVTGPAGPLLLTLLVWRHTLAVPTGQDAGHSTPVTAA